MLGIRKKNGPSAYELFECSVRGFSHIRKDIPCEDYGMRRDLGEIKIFAIADGHGDPNCLRSSVGSEYACTVACDTLESFARNIADNGFEERLFDRIECTAIMDRLIRSIVGKWISDVDEHLQQNPLTDEEYRTASRLAEEYRRGIRPERMYGTTLIAGLLTERYLLLLQQGDGRCVVFDSEGRASQPIPWDDRCVGTATTSLCDADAARSVRYHLIDLDVNHVIACVAGTDGVEDSFPNSMEKTHAYYRDILAEACEKGVEETEKALADDLSELSRQGSADDVTVGGLIDVRQTRKFLPDFERANLLVNTRDELALVQGRIKSMESGGMLEHLSKKYDGTALAYRTAEERFTELDGRCRELEETLAAQEQETIPGSEKISSELMAFISKLHLTKDMLAPIKKELENVSAQRDEAKASYEAIAAEMHSIEERYLPRKEKYDALLKQKEEINARLSELESKSQG